MLCEVAPKKVAQWLTFFSKHCDKGHDGIFKINLQQIKRSRHLITNWTRSRGYAARDEMSKWVILTQWADHIQEARRISARLSDWVVNNARSPHLRPHQQCIGITSCAHSANNNSFIGNNLCKIPSIHVSWSFQSGIFYVKSPTCVPLSAGRWPSQGAWLRLVMVGLCTAVRFPNPWNNQQAGWEAWQWWWSNL